MEHFYFIDHENKMIYQTFRGEITIPGALECLNKLADDEFYDSNFAVMTDLRQASFRASRQAFNNFYQQVLKLLPASGRKSAFVVNDPMISAFALLFAKHSENTRAVRVFTEQNSACDWLSGELGHRVFPRLNEN